ncbi:MAG: TetR/AcrR family transcriptional regulator [Bryobacteraceae bacterium]
MNSSDRNRVLDAALELVGGRELGAITLDDLSTAAGVSAFGIVREFQSKENILKAVLERELELMAAAAHDPELRLPGETLRDELITMANVILDEYRRRLPLLSRLLTAAMQDPEAGALFYRTFIVQGRQLFAGFLETRVRVGELRPDLDVEAASAMFLSSLTGALLMVELFGGKTVEDLDDSRLVQRTADIFLKGAARA